MKKYFEKYIEAKSLQNSGKSLEHKLVWQSSGLKISPRHFNHFYFEIGIFGETPALTVNDARDLGKWLLQATEGIDDPHKIVAEINKP